MKITKKVSSENARSSASQGTRGVLYLIERFLRLLPVEGSVSEKCKIEETLKIQKTPAGAKIGGCLIFLQFFQTYGKNPIRVGLDTSFYSPICVCTGNA